MHRSVRRLIPVVTLAAAAGCHTVSVPAGPSADGGRAVRLPLREMPARGPGSVFAVLLTGDGIFPGMTDEIAKTLAQAGYPSVVWSSMRYYVHPHSPDESARDLDRVIRWYGARWHRPDVVLVGYSMGADVLPFLVNRLPDDTRQAVKGLALLGVSDDAVFQFRVEEWWQQTSAPTLPTLPEVQRLTVPNRFCAYGEGDDETACQDFTQYMNVFRLSGGHHFNGQVAQVKGLVLELAQKAENASAPQQASTQ